MKGLQSLPNKFNKHITDEGGDDGDEKIGSGKNISDSPGQASPLSSPRALEFTHQEIGIKKEDNETHLDHGSPHVFLHPAPPSFPKTKIDSPDEEDE